MVGGGLMSLIAYGPQDVYLTNNLSNNLTFCKVLYRKYTNFAYNEIEFKPTIPTRKYVNFDIELNNKLDKYEIKYKNIGNTFNIKSTNDDITNDDVNIYNLLNNINKYFIQFL